MANLCGEKHMVEEIHLLPWKWKQQVQTKTDDFSPDYAPSEEVHENMKSY